MCAERCKHGSEASSWKPTVEIRQGAGFLAYGLMQGCWLGATALGNGLLFIGPILYKRISISATWSIFVIVCAISMFAMLAMVKWLERVTK